MPKNFPGTGLIHGPKVSVDFEVPGEGPHTLIKALKITHSCTLDLLPHVEVNYKNLLAKIGRHW